MQEAWEIRKRHEPTPLAYTYKTDANGKLLPVPFEEGLSVLMPHDARTVDCRSFENGSPMTVSSNAAMKFRLWRSKRTTQALRLENGSKLSPLAFATF